MKKMMALFTALMLVLSLAACGGGEETTLTGMVASVEGTVLSLVEMDTANMGSMEFAEGGRPQRPEGMEGFGDFDPEAFAGTLPEGETFPQWEEGQMPEGMTPPDGMTPPEGMTMPAEGEMPDFGGQMPNFGGFAADAETKELDIADAHISVEIEGGKASGTMDDIRPGTFVTVTVNGKGQVTNVLVSSMSGFRFGFGGGRPGGNGA